MGGEGLTLLDRTQE